MRLARARAVARFEFLATVRRLSFVLTTVGLPVLLFGVTIASAVLQRDLVRTMTTAGVRIGLVAPEEILPASVRLPEVLRTPDERAALDLLERGVVDHVYLVERSWRATGRVRHVTRGGESPMFRDDATPTRLVEALLRRSLLAEVADARTVERAVEPVVLVRERLEGGRAVVETGEEVAQAIAAVMVPMLLAVLLLSALLMASGYLVQAVSADKETRIVEVLLASATPEELLVGKLVGLGGAGLLQFGVFSGLSAIVSSLVARAMPTAFEPPREALLAAPVLFLLGFVFLGAFMLALGALGGSVAESQKLTLGVVLVAVLPLLAFPVIIESPHGGLARGFCYVPFTAPVAAVIRLAVDPRHVPLLDWVLVPLGLVASIGLVLYLGGKLFRIGLLLTGSFPGFAQVWRQLRAPR